MTGIKFYLQRERFDTHISIFARCESNFGGQMQMAYPDAVVWRRPEPKEEALHRPPLLQIEPAAAQQLMDALWDCGFRPTEGTGSAGALAAVQGHLKDMRAIVAKELKVNL